MGFSRKAAEKIFTVTIIACIVFLFVVFIPKKKPDIHLPAFSCQKDFEEARKHDGEKTENFSCYATYYEKLTELRGVRAAFEDIKARKETDPYVKQECHLMTHIIGRKAASMSTSTAEAFSLGEYFCGGGYFHGVMESVIRQYGKASSTPFLYGLCAPFREKDHGGFSVEHMDCAHGIGHGLMYMNSNELFASLHECDSLLDTQEQYPCWVGVFMENGLADAENHSTKYLKMDDLMYPCDSVDEKYKSACYDIQTSYILRTTGSFEKMFKTCRESPERFQSRCFVGIGRDIAVETDMDIERSKMGCLELSTQKTEREDCLRAVVGARIHYYHSLAEGEKFCRSLPEEFKESCFNAALAYVGALGVTDI